jgi:hypothetical protein
MSDNKVQSRTIDYGAMVRKQWGKEWNKPEIAYEFSNGRKFDETKYEQGYFLSDYDDEGYDQ